VLTNERLCHLRRHEHRDRAAGTLGAAGSSTPAVAGFVSERLAASSPTNACVTRAGTNVAFGLWAPEINVPVEDVASRK
jgi:hypothetical protein